MDGEDGGWLEAGGHHLATPEGTFPLVPPPHFVLVTTPLVPPPGLRPPYRVLRRAEHCAPLTRYGLAFSQPSKGLATPPARGTVLDSAVQESAIIAVRLFRENCPPGRGTNVESVSERNGGGAV